VLSLIVRKIVQGTLMILIVSAISFGLLASAGGDALSRLRENPQISEETIERLRRVYGLDRPVTERYVAWLSAAVAGDLGESLYYRMPVARLVWQRLVNTLALAAIALALTLGVSFLFAYLSARHRSRLLGGFIEAIILISASTPRIVLALIGLLIIASAPWAAGGAWASGLIAAAALAVPLTAVFLAQASRGMGEAMNEDFVKLARAKGLSERTVIIRHAARAALNPVITLFGLSIGALIGGSVLVETILGWPGVGALTVTAVRGRDVPLLMGVVLITSAAVWMGNTAAEFLQVVNDKRLRDAETI
jgi:peptide/nickel transport system permease protein